MKHFDLIFSCSSSSSTATLYAGSKPRSTTSQHHHRLGGGGDRKGAAGCLCPAVMCGRPSFNLPIDPKAYYNYFEKGRKSRSGAKEISTGDLRRRSAADIADLIKPADLRSNSWHVRGGGRDKDSKYFDLLDDSTKKTELVRRQDHDNMLLLQQQQSRHSISLDGSPYPPTSSSSSSSSSSSYTARCSRKNQVVELRVSIHCKGCEGKVRKHISKMEGVTSVDIDLAMKKVTVVGDVTPLGVLASISQVKSAQLWPSPPYSYSSSSSNSSSSS